MKLTENPIALGCMTLSGTWSPSDMDASHEARAIAAFEAAFEAGITFYDHADIYGGGTCETVFAKCLAAVPGSREKITIATKCGIRSGHYNLTAPYIESCIDRSLKRMNIDYIDLFQMHRPDPLTHPSETAMALNAAVQSGKVRAIGVSNYYPEQVRALQTYLLTPIVSNQISISLARLDPFYEGLSTNANNERVGDGVLDQCMAQGIVPLAYSPLGGGGIARGEAKTERETATYKKLVELGVKYSATSTQIALAWLIAHPSGIVPLVGSANPAHIREAVGAGRIKLEREDWYALWAAAWGQTPP